MQELLKQELNLTIENEYIILDVVEPLMNLVESNNLYYFIYTLQDRRIKTKDGKRAHVYEVLVSKTTLNDVIDFLDEKITLQQVIGDGEIYKIGKIANKIFPKKIISNLHEIKEKLPKDDLYLTPLIPNKVDVGLLKRELLELTK